MQLKLRQVFYKEDQPLDGGCIPYSAVDYEPRYYENQHILDLYEKGDHLDCDYWGLTSFRMYEKTELNYVDIASYITSNPGKDAYLYLNHGDAQNLLQNEDFPIGKVIKRLYETGIIPFENKNLDWVNIFCNYWVAKPHIVEDYIETILKPAIKAFENDEYIKDIIHNEVFFYRGRKYPYDPFILEYLFGLYLLHNKHVSYARVPDKHMKQRLMSETKRSTMKPLKDIYEKYKQENKMAGCGDKGTLHYYIESYDKLFNDYRELPINILEIGVAQGDSLKMWKEYFPHGNVYGIDVELPKSIPGIHMCECSQIDQQKLHDIFKDVAFDIIIDDGSHKIQHQLLSAKYLWNKLKVGGLYVIEDIQEPDLDIPTLSLGFRKPTEVIDTRNTSKRYDDILMVWKK